MFAHSENAVNLAAHCLRVSDRETGLIRWNLEQAQCTTVATTVVLYSYSRSRSRRYGFDKVLSKLHAAFETDLNIPANLDGSDSNLSCASLAL